MNEIRKRKFLSQAELQKLLSYVKIRSDLAREKGTTRAIIDELIVLLLVRVGLRANEIQALKIEDIPRVHDEKVLTILNVKGNSPRLVDISEEMAQVLTKFVRLYRKGAGKNDLLLVTERGNPFGYMSLYNKVRRIGEYARIDQLTPAILQHTYMVRLFETERDLRYVQEQTGYVSRRTLNKYLMKGHTESARRNSKQKKSQIDKRICEACGTECATRRGRLIESGQFLCQACLEYFSYG